jgi:hypothetical protein
LQSIGKSTQSFDRFLEAFRLGTKVGESSKKLQVIADMFYWYRQHGSCLKLFGKQPSYRERIDGEYCNCEEKHEYDERVARILNARPLISVTSLPISSALCKVPDYHSEYGTNPKQAATVREFMFGIGEVIAGIFGYCVIPFKGQSFALTTHGVYLIGSSLHNLYTEHEIALLEFKKLTDEAEAVAK